MNEVRPTQLVSQLAARTASSKGSVVDTGKSSSAEGSAVGNALPPEQKVDDANKVKADSKMDLQDAVADINQYVQKVSRDLHFSIDDDSGRTVIRVVDRGSGDLIRQIPEDIFLRLARNLKNDEPINLVNAHG